MDNSDVEDKIRAVCRADPRFDSQAYFFIFEALDHAIVTLGKTKYEGPKRHVTGRELLDSIRIVAQRQFGWLAKTVFDSWGVHKTDDFGEMVFNMVQAELLHKQETDSMADFRDGYDFTETFEKDYDFEIPWDSMTPRSK